MQRQDYTLDVISHYPDPQFNGKKLKKYMVEGVPTMGVYGNEIFSIVFKNNTSKRVQTVISLDGTSVITGKPASTEPTEKMFVVAPYDSLELKAWVESNDGGAEFVFTSGGNGVAINTHGDTSSRGIIAAAVFVEGHQEPARVEEHHHWYYGHDRLDMEYIFPVLKNTTYTGDASTTTKGMRRSKSTAMFNNISDSNDAPVACAGGVAASMDSLEELVSVGAGQYTDQKITYAKGLIKPMFTEAVRLRYMWYNDLVEKLKEIRPIEAHPSGFPADKNDFVKLGNTPRVGEKTPSRTVVPNFSRV